MAMTYGQLLDKLNSMDKDKLPMNVSIFIDGEMLEVESVEINEGDSDIIDDGHPYLLVEE